MDVVIRFSGLPICCLPAESSTRGVLPDITYYLEPSFRGLELVLELELELDLSANDVIIMGIVKICCTIGQHM